MSTWMKVTKIHRIYRFITPKKRTKSDTNFEKDSNKLLNNAFFGETMENVKNRTDLDLISL